jgi:predicted NUDIX family NTP pyrophosphohydrolase
LLAAAAREFKEEVGITPSGKYVELGAIRQKSGKIVHAWAFSGDWDEAQPVQSTTFELEWPPNSGRRQRFPEVDRAGFFPVPQARYKLKAVQHLFLDRLRVILEKEGVI